MAEPDWKAYERHIDAALREQAGQDAVVTFDTKLWGRFSEVSRQIDVLVQGRFAGRPGEHTMVVDCKCFSTSVDVKDVEAFLGMVEDVKADLGMLVTRTGFSPAAQRRAVAVRGIVVEVVPFNDLATWVLRRPAVVWTAGSEMATLTWFPAPGRLQTDRVSREFGKRVLDEYRRDQEEGRAPADDL